MVEFEQNRGGGASVYQQSSPKPKAWGPTIGLIIILLLIIVGSLYFFRNEQTVNTTGTPENDLASIESDLNSSGSFEIDNDINSAEQEINQI